MCLPKGVAPIYTASGMTYKVQILKKCDDYIPEAPDLHNHMNIKVPLKCHQESHAAIQILVLTTLVNI